MVEKKEGKHLYNEESLGIAGFTLGVLSIIMTGWMGIMIAIVGFFLCLYQQKKHPTRTGKIGLILNIIGFVLGIIFLIAFIKYLAPKMQEIMRQIQASQNFPVA